VLTGTLNFQVTASETEQAKGLYAYSCMLFRLEKTHISCPLFPLARSSQIALPNL
jgi:hypothetical protein